MVVFLTASVLAPERNASRSLMALQLLAIVALLTPQHSSLRPRSSGSRAPTDSVTAG